MLVYEVLKFLEFYLKFLDFYLMFLNLIIEICVNSLIFVKKVVKFLRSV